MISNAAEDAPFYSRVQQTLLYHQGLLRDEVRNKLFYEALKCHITDETNVLDIGAGSGVGELGVFDPGLAHAL